MKLTVVMPVWVLTFLFSFTSALNLNVTALNGRNGKSVLECWQLQAPFSISSQAGTAGSAITQLGDVANMTFTVLPASYDGGIHNAPYAQWVVFTAGLAYITLPYANSSEVYVSGGEFGLIFAADTAKVSKTGHRTVYPGITETIALQIPTKDGKIPPHNVTHQGPCFANETLGLRNLVTG